MSSDIARGVIAKLREENSNLKRQNEILELLLIPEVYFTHHKALMALKKSNEPKRHAKNRRCS